MSSIIKKFLECLKYYKIKYVTAEDYLNSSLMYGKIKNVCVDCDTIGYAKYFENDLEFHSFLPENELKIKSNVHKSLKWFGIEYKIHDFCKKNNLNIIRLSEVVTPRPTLTSF